MTGQDRNLVKVDACRDPRDVIWHLPEDQLGKNPYGRLLMRSLEAMRLRVIPISTEPIFAWQALRDRPDVVHFQFVQPYLLPALQPNSRWRAVVKGGLFILQVLLLRWTGSRIVWTVHNLVNHERRLARYERFFTRLFTRLTDVVIVQCEAARDEVVSIYKMETRLDRIHVLPHPNYSDAYPDRIDRREARASLDVHDRRIIILCLGQIRTYKGLESMVRAFQTLGAPGCELRIAGEAVEPSLTAALRRSAEGDDAIHVHASFLSPDEVEILMKACDIVALPYLSILTSGSAVLAMTFGRPCIAPRLGCLPEILDELGAFLYEAGDPDGLRDALARAVEAGPALQEMGRHNRSRVQAWSWPATAEALVRLYRLRRV
ncbi:glycosyltransferase [Synechococcus sp. Cruz-9H2]|uniref:glycosyltransferase n=1 Tax=unclassified Synechococcus TaxID=2626047 RepID=UPI0020CECC79|nr:MULTISPECIES: glycosyltransferase [unclassified Synechococcus]MCP9820986.1 glycosyltransferase [Synechococcus sp. Cruz-9H2]MCP9857397.1 glycosyltransferase [Synechococcus sp. Cruz-9C9]MCP9871907.1 glycosyltransferase [Synechococcus sp. Cruz-7B9]